MADRASIDPGNPAPGTQMTSSRDIPSYRQAAAAVLSAAQPLEKCEAAARAYQMLADGRVSSDHDPGNPPPDRPARPKKPELLPPNQVPRRRLGTPEGRFALLHAVAHIELNAIDLAFDMAGRFASEIDSLGLDAGHFVEDWFCVGADEARHFKLLHDALVEYGGGYGDLPAHDGLWQIAADTSDSVLARLAIAPMVLEARGLDVTPGMIEKFEKIGDDKNASRLTVIYRDEVGHVEKGVFWFNAVCQAKKLVPEPTFRSLVRSRFAGQLKPPFNQDARRRANLTPEYYDTFVQS